MSIKREELPVIKLENLTKKFGEFYAVQNINLEIFKGEVVGFLGPNGAGKSTTMKMMAYLLKPTHGTVYIRSNGHLEPLNSSSKDRLLRHIGFLVENPSFYDTVTPRQILTYFAKLKGYPRGQIKKRVEEVVELVGLSQWIDKRIKTFSKGMKQKIGLVSAIVHDPDIIVLDEPYTGLDPEARKEVRNFILDLKKAGKTVFLSSHLLFEVSEVADRIAIINHGHLIACDTLENLEQLAKHSVIRMEVLRPPARNQWGKMIYDLYEILAPIVRIKPGEKNYIRYNLETHVFEIFFNGDAETQYKILKALIENGIEVIEFSVPKANLLEDLYLDLVNTESSSTPSSSGSSNTSFSSIKIEKIF